MQQTAPTPPATNTSAEALRNEISALQLAIAERTAEYKTAMAKALSDPRPAAELTPQERTASQRLEQQMRELNRLIVTDQARLELLQVRLAQATAGTQGENSATTVVPPPGIPPLVPRVDRDMEMVGIALTLFVLAPLAIGYAWRLIRRTGGGQSQRELVESNERMRRIEQSIEAIAIEVERVSENQRFLTRALAEPDAGVRLTQEPIARRLE